MAKIVEITQSSDTVTCDENGQATLLFDINNISPASLRVGAYINAEEPAQSSWFKIEGSTEKKLSNDATDQYTVQVDANNAPAGNYKLRLLVYNVENSDEDYTESETIAVNVPAQKVAPEPEPKSNMWIVWLLVGLLVIALLGVAAYFVFRSDESTENPTAISKKKDDTYIDFGLNGVKRGSFFQTAPKVWSEWSDEQKKYIYHFVEKGRDQWSVYLLDPARNANLQIDLHTKKIFYSSATIPRREIYQVLGRSDKYSKGFPLP